MDNKQLAIVIPAYKIDFFRATLDSLAAQTCKDFAVYIGDDCSPANFEGLVNEYRNKLDIHYQKFVVNMGSRDLVSQWKRCINMTQGEPWLWLFSDDDLMGKRCVELFFNAISHNESVDLFHFNVDIIDANGHIIKQTTRYPKVLASKSFYKKKSSAQLDSFVVEYIFSRKIYETVDGFQPFDLAWGSDIATWVKMGKEKGIYTLYGDFVYWRKSNKNITPNLERNLVLRKFHIDVDFYKWINEYFGTFEIKTFNKYVFFRYIVYYSQSLGYKDIKGIMDKAKVNNVINATDEKILLAIFPFLKFVKYIKLKLIS